MVLGKASHLAEQEEGDRARRERDQVPTAGISIDTFGWNAFLRPEKGIGSFWNLVVQLTRCSLEDFFMNWMEEINQTRWIVMERRIGVSTDKDEKQKNIWIICLRKREVKLDVAPSKCQSLLLSLSGPLKIKILLPNITCGVNAFFFSSTSHYIHRNLRLYFIRDFLTYIPMFINLSCTHIYFPLTLCNV